MHRFNHKFTRVIDFYINQKWFILLFKILNSWSFILSSFSLFFCICNKSRSYLALFFLDLFLCLVSTESRDVSMLWMLKSLFRSMFIVSCLSWTLFLNVNVLIPTILSYFVFCLIILWIISLKLLTLASLWFSKLSFGVLSLMDFLGFLNYVRFFYSEMWLGFRLLLVWKKQ